MAVAPPKTPAPVTQPKPTAATAPATTAAAPAPKAAPLPATNPVKVIDWKSQLAAGETGAQTRSVGANETVESQLNDLTRSNSKYIGNARLGAREQAAERGMLMSSVAAGAGERAAIEAALPIAQQDASTYSRVASENMAATNTDRLADQSMYGNLLGQEVGIRANLDEAERQRGFTAGENALSRQFQTNERLGQQAFQTAERLGQQEWSRVENQLNRDLELTRQAQDQVWQSIERELDRDASVTQQDKQLAQQRFQQFDAAMQQYNTNLTQTLMSIYSNPNLSASQQAAAAENAKALHASLFKSYAATMASGVPEIFWEPYMAGGAGGGAPAPAVTAPVASRPVATAPGGSGGGTPVYSGARPATGSNTIPQPTLGSAPWRNLGLMAAER